MAGSWAAVVALARIAWRRQRQLQSLAGNNFFVFGALFLQASGAFLFLIVALLALLPLTASPLDTRVRARVDSWPLTPAGRRFLLIVSPWLSPAAGITLLVLTLLSREIGAVLLGLVFASQWILTHRPESRSGHSWTAARLSGDFRNLARTLDVYLALAIGWGGAAWRFFGPPTDPEAWMALSILAALALSSRAQCLFALDGAGGITRFRLLPIRGWRILLSKDTTFLAVLAAAVLPLSPVAGLAAGLAMLAAGHHVAVSSPFPQSRWTFASGSLGVGVVQVLLGVGAGVAAFRFHPAFLALAALAWALSVAFYGWAFDNYRFEDPG